MKYLCKTLLFWNWQLILFEYSEKSLRVVTEGYMKYSEGYKANEYTKKIRYLLAKRKLSEKDKQCIATHISLQLAGVK